MDALDLLLTLGLIGLAGRLPWTEGFFVICMWLPLWLVLDLSANSVPPTDEDIDRIMGAGYSEWLKKERDRAKRHNRRKR